MESFYFARHGETDFNLQKRWMGKIDVPMNKTGISQIYSLASRLKGFDIEVIYCSPLLRATESARILMREANIPALEIVPGLSERDLGDFEGLEKTDENYQRLQKAVSPESHEGFTQRVIKSISAIFFDKKVLIVSHSGVFRVIQKNNQIFHLPNHEKSLGNGELVEVKVRL